MALQSVQIAIQSGVLVGLAVSEPYGLARLEGGAPAKRVIPAKVPRELVGCVTDVLPSPNPPVRASL